jgi:hypothetical protein
MSTFAKDTLLGATVPFSFVSQFTAYDQ